MRDIRKIISLGGFDNKVRLGGVEINATDYELEEFAELLADLISEETILQLIRHDDYLLEKIQEEFFNDEEEYLRPYNPKAKIMEMFNDLYDETRTKKEVFEEIAEELGITFKAVEKAYYSK